MNAFNLIVRAGTMLAVLAGTPRAEAEAARPCAERAEVVARLAERFGETLRSVGLQRGDAVVEVYSSEATGTWTILLTRPDGLTCLLAAGERWEQDAKPITAPGRDP
jgi:hypothetical protein